MRPEGERERLPGWELSKSKSIHSSMDGFLPRWSHRAAVIDYICVGVVARDPRTIQVI